MEKENYARTPKPDLAAVRPRNWLKPYPTGAGVKAFPHEAVGIEFAGKIYWMGNQTRGN
jgi:hypothetical protein